MPGGDGRSFSHRIKLNEVAHRLLRDALVPYQPLMNTFRRIKAGPWWDQ